MNTATMLLAADEPLTTAGPTQLIIAALVGIAAIVALIVWGKIHPFLALMLGSAVLALTAGIALTDTFTAFTAGVGSTVGGTGVLIALGAIIGTLLVKSGGADAIVEGFLHRTTPQKLPWVMAALAFIIGIPLFFEVGVVLLIPVVMLAAKRARQPVILLGIPALAGLSALHGLVPPHPGPLIAIDALGANLGLTLGLGLIVAVSLSVVLLPVVLMLLRTLVETVWADGAGNAVHGFGDRRDDHRRGHHVAHRGGVGSGDDGSDGAGDRRRVCVLLARQ